MISALKQHQTFGRLALLTAVLLFAGQTISAQHIHAGELEADCVVCATIHHDDAIATNPTTSSLQPQSAHTFNAVLAPCFRAVSEYRQGPRAPPAS